jgi:hypothetical protein
MTEWSGPEFTNHSNAASNQATKPKLRGVHKVLQNQHQHRHYCKHLALTSFSITKLSSTLPLLSEYCFSISLSVPLARHSSEEDAPPFYVLLSMTEWSGPEFTYHSNTASNQATKPKLHGVHKVLQNQHQHRHDCKHLALTSLSITKLSSTLPLLLEYCLSNSLSQSHWLGTALRKMLPPFTSYFRWLSDQGQSSRTIVTRRPTKPQSQSCPGFTKSYKTNTNTAMIANTLLSLLSLLQIHHQHCHYCRKIA